MNPLQGGWPFKCSDRPINDVSSNCMVQGFGRATDDSIFHVDSGWNPPYNGYHLAYDIKVIYSTQDLATRNYKKVFAPANGRVKYAAFVLGYTVVIQFDLPLGDPDGPSVSGVFYHMLQPVDGGIMLAVGQAVNIGDTIGYVSPFEKDFGHGSAPHQHFGIRKGTYVAGNDTTTPTGFWHYPGYTTVCTRNTGTGECEIDPVTHKVIRENDRTDLRHTQIISQWLDPYNFLLNHSSGVPQPGTVTVQATLDGFAWSGPVNYTLTCAGHSLDGSAVPRTFLNELAGTCAVSGINGSPPYSTLNGISPSVSQSLAPGGTISYSLNFKSNPPSAGFLMSYGTQSKTDGQELDVKLIDNGSATVNFDATSRSSAVNGATITSWMWFVDGLVAATSGTFSKTIPIGTHPVGLVVTDSRGGQSTAVEGMLVVSQLQAQLSRLYTFSKSNGVLPVNGAFPQGSLIQGTDGLLYGVTNGGGSYDDYPQANCYNNGCGTIFKTDLAGNLTSLHQFKGADGAFPAAGLVQGSDGFLYGTTTNGGTQLKCATNGGVSGCGTVYRIGPSGNFSTLHSFTETDGAFPWGKMIQGTDGYFYGTTQNGGSSSCNPQPTATPGCGNIFRMDGQGNLTVLHVFAGPDGSQPYAGLIQGRDRNFYGTTTKGGTSDLGTVFKMDAAGNVTVLHSFTGPDGSRPSAALLQATDGFFYGTTDGGLANSAGTVFKIDALGNFTLLHTFSGTDGSYPFAGLIQNTDGILYGTTQSGGSLTGGTVFAIDASGAFTSIHSFAAGSDGSVPLAGLVPAGNGYLYGSACFGGPNNGFGVIYQLIIH